MNQTAMATIINPALAYQKPLEEYIQYLEKLNLRSVALLENFVVPLVYYSDGMMDVHGCDSVIESFRVRIKRYESCKIRVTNYGWGRENNAVYLRWVLEGIRSGEAVTIQGVSEIMFSHDGRVMSHIDFSCERMIFPEKARRFPFFRRRGQ